MASRSASDTDLIRPDELMEFATRSTTAGVLQPLTGSSAAETYYCCIRELQSVGCPTWVEAARSAATSSTNNFTLYLFGTDAGSDNTGTISAVKRDLDSCAAVAFHASFCYFHQMHLIVKHMLTVLDSWRWPEPHQPKTKYFSA
eukprot:8804436-Pyramimonas_sp.AAC.1